MVPLWRRCWARGWPSCPGIKSSSRPRWGAMDLEYLTSGEGGEHCTGWQGSSRPRLMLPARLWKHPGSAPDGLLPSQQHWSCRLAALSCAVLRGLQPVCTRACTDCRSAPPGWPRLGVPLVVSSCLTCLAACTSGPCPGDSCFFTLRSHPSLIHVTLMQTNYTDLIQL